MDPTGLLNRFDDMFARVVAPAFGRREPGLRAEAYLLGLVAGLERANGGRSRSSPGTGRRCGCSGC